MDAANGIYAVFRVEAIMNVTAETYGNAGRRQRTAKRQERKQEDLFANILAAATGDREEVSEALPTTVYERNGRMAEAYYGSRDYHY